MYTLIRRALKTVENKAYMVPPVGNAPTPSGFSDPRSDFISYRGIWYSLVAMLHAPPLYQNGVLTE